MITNRDLVFLRHCQVAVDATQSPAAWSLTEGGVDDAGRLAQSTLFTSIAVVAAGDEPKMVESVKPLADHHGLEVLPRAGLSEAATTWVDESVYDDVVRRFLAEPGEAPAPDWERADDAVDRFLAAVHELAGTDQDGEIVVCTGARVLTATLVRLGLIGADDAFETWRTLQMPDVVGVSFDENGDSTLKSRTGL